MNLSVYMNRFNIFKMEIKSKLLIWYSKRSGRSKDIAKNISVSLLMRAASILASLLLVPLTINYVNPTQYGIWLALSSIIGWVTFFDLGLGNGFRNKFTEAKAHGNDLLAKKLVSTTYITISIIVFIVFFAAYLVNEFLNWSDILKVSQSYKDELSRVFIIVILFTCVNMVANVFATLLQADQKPGIASVITAIGQYVSLIVIFLLSKFTEGNLYNLAVFYSGIPCCVMLTASLFFFILSPYKKYSPSFSTFDKKLIRQIMGLGYQFFIIYVCLIAIFQIINLVITREIGPLGVTQYNIVNRYFNIIYMLINILVTPFWSAFTDAYAKKDFVWMKSMVKKLQLCWYSFIILGFVMLLFSSFFYRIWIGDRVNIPFYLSLAMFFFSITQSLGTIYMYLINGIGTIRIQLITYVIFAMLSWPLLTYSARYLGLGGIIIIPAIVYLVQGLLAKKQVEKILNNEAFGIWIK